MPFPACLSQHIGQPGQSWQSPKVVLTEIEAPVLTRAALRIDPTPSQRFSGTLFPTRCKLATLMH